MGKFHGTMIPTTPERLVEGHVDPAGHRDLAPAVPLGRGGVVLQHVPHVARLPAGIADHVTGVGHLEPGQLLAVGVHGRRRSAAAGAPGHRVPRRAMTRRPPRRGRWPRRPRARSGRERSVISSPVAGLRTIGHSRLILLHGLIIAHGGRPGTTPAAAPQPPPGTRGCPVRFGHVDQPLRGGSDRCRSGGSRLDRARLTGAVQPGQGVRDAGGDPGRPGVLRVARAAAQLRPVGRALASPGRLPARARAGRPRPRGTNWPATSPARTTSRWPSTTGTSTSKGCWARSEPGWPRST